jgi:hypothetical protein
MEIVQKIMLSPDIDNAAVILGGNTVRLTKWPVNPDGVPLILIATLYCSAIKGAVGLNAIPAEGTIYIFSTYSESDYFLDKITYDGAVSERDIKEIGYTHVVMSDTSVEISGTERFIPRTMTTLAEQLIEDNSHPMLSMISNSLTNDSYISPTVSAEYAFVMQLYSSDFPYPFKDIFYLTDAVGCLFLKKDGSGQGLFFVHTA